MKQHHISAEPRGANAPRVAVTLWNRLSVVDNSPTRATTQPATADESIGTRANCAHNGGMLPDIAAFNMHVKRVHQEKSLHQE